MNLTNYYWYFQSAVPARICDEIVKYGKSISRSNGSHWWLWSR
jgi:hypothetical protein